MQTDVFYHLKFKNMFGLFKKKSEKQVLVEQYKKLMKESHSLSTTDRTESDKKYAEAQEVMDKVDKMDGK
jgi:hypothetical protein